MVNFGPLAAEIVSLI